MLEFSAKIVRYMFTGWDELNGVQKFVKIFFLWGAVIEMAILVVVAILFGINYFICFFLKGNILGMLLHPIVSFIFGAVMIIVGGVGVLLGYLFNMYDIKQYSEFVSKNYSELFSD